MLCLNPSEAMSFASSDDSFTCTILGQSSAACGSSMESEMTTFSISDALIISAELPVKSLHGG